MTENTPIETHEHEREARPPWSGVLDFPHYPRREENTGHGHVYPRPDGHKWRCGSIGSCNACTSDGLEAATAWTTATLAAGADAAADELRAATAMLAGVGAVLLEQRDSAIRANAMTVAARESFGARGLFQMPSGTF